MMIMMIIPILVTLVGIITDVSDEHPLKVIVSNNSITIDLMIKMMTKIMMTKVLIM